MSFLKDMIFVSFFFVVLLVNADPVPDRMDASGNKGEDDSMLVQDVNGQYLNQTGNLTCWISHHLDGGPLDKPVLSKPIHKYCTYMWLASRTPFTLGYLYETSLDDYLEESWNENPNQSMLMIVETLKITKPHQTSRTFYCKTEACNHPGTLLKFLQFNGDIAMKAAQAKAMKAAENNSTST